MRRVAHLILTGAAALLVDPTIAYCPASVMASCGRGAFVAASRHGTNTNGERGPGSTSSYLGPGRCGQPCTTGLGGVGGGWRRSGAMSMLSSQGVEAGPRKCKVYDVRGELVPYTEALAWQKSLQSDRIKFKQAKQKGEEGGVGDKDTDALVLVEHPTVYTLGSSSEMSHILFPLDEASIAKVGDVVSVEGQDGGFDVHRVQRGGKITYHCPGQLVGYPILDLARHQQDIGWYLREIEGVVIDALASFGVEATTVSTSNQPIQRIHVNSSPF
jgi:lipoate-protein ligase B